jgi:hypothetical protein
MVDRLSPGDGSVGSAGGNCRHVAENQSVGRMQSASWGCQRSSPPFNSDASRANKFRPDKIRHRDEGGGLHPPYALTAYDLYLRAHAMYLSARQIPEALGRFEQAIERDPRCGPALASAAVCCNRRHFDIYIWWKHDGNARALPTY